MRSLSTLLLVAAAATLTTTATACSRGPETPKAVAATTLATVDGRDITNDEIEKAYRAAVDPAAGQPSDIEALGAKLSLLDDFINQDLLLARAKSLNLEVTDAEVDTAFADRKR